METGVDWPGNCVSLVVTRISTMPRARKPATRAVAPALEVADQLPKLTLRQLSYFLAAANHQSVRKAAQALHVSAPSVSTAIAQIETTIEAQLFVRRHARGLLLTEAGRDLAVSARNMLSYAREIETAGRGAATYSGRLSIGCLLTVAPFLIPPLLRGFAESYPRTQIRWREGNHESLGEGLEMGAVDVAILYDFDIPRSIHCTPLRTMPLQIVLPAGHELARRARVSLFDILEEPLILLDLPKSRDYFLSVFGELGLTPKIAHRTTSFDMLRCLVANGLGYSLLNFCPPLDFPYQGAIVSRPLVDGSKQAQLVLARLHRYRAPAIIEDLTRRVRELAAELPVNATADVGRTSAGPRLRVVQAAFPRMETHARKRRRHGAKLLP
jgi:DNA-binding transcriptional LysR family regulator